MSFSLDDFIEAATEAGRSQTYITETSAYVRKLTERGYPVLFSLQHLAIEMGVKSNMLKWIVENRGIKYSYFKLPKRRGGFREIMIPNPDLKFVQAWIAKNILSKYPLTDSCCGFREGYSTFTNAAVHARAQIILKVDLLKFYDTVTEQRIFGVFRGMGYHPNLAFYLAQLTTGGHRRDYWENIKEPEEKSKLSELMIANPAILPQGAPSSPMLSNIIANRLDQRLAGLSKKYGFRYTRYADDLSFSAVVYKSLPSIELIEKIIEEEGFYLNKKKCSYFKRGVKQYVTGLTVTHGVHVSKKYRRTIFTHLRFARIFGPADHLKRHYRKTKINETSRSAFQDWLLGSISYISSVDKKTGEKMFSEFNKIDWSIR